MKWKFTYDGITGLAVDGGAFVLWGGMGFQIEAACEAMKAAVLKGKK